MTAAQQDLAFSHIIPDLNDILERGRGFHHLDTSLIDGLCMFEHDHGISSLRKCSARGDLHGLTRCDTAVGQAPHRDFVDDREICRLCLTRSERIRTLYRIAIHGRAGEFRQVNRRADVLCRDPAAGVADVNLFCIENSNCQRRL